jgi:hypothetical protein
MAGIISSSRMADTEISPKKVVEHCDGDLLGLPPVRPSRHDPYVRYDLRPACLAVYLAVGVGRSRSREGPCQQ